MRLISFFIILFSFKIQAKAIEDFRLPYFEDKAKEFSLYKDTKGKKVVINFWAAWCTECAKEIPELEQLKKSYPKAIFLGVNAGEKASKVKRFIKKRGFSYTILWDKDRKISKKLGVKSLPQTIVLDKNKNIIYHSHLPPKKI